MTRNAADLDYVARQLAARAGVCWDELNDYPGYTKNCWRDEARDLLAAIAADAKSREPAKA